MSQVTYSRGVETFSERAVTLVVKVVHKPTESAPEKLPSLASLKSNLRLAVQRRSPKAKANAVKLIGDRTFKPKESAPVANQRNPLGQRKIKHGLIVWYDGCPPMDGDREKRRPVIVVEPIFVDSESCQAFAIVVACSATAGPREADSVDLPSRDRQPQTTTGLPRMSSAIPRWFLPIPLHTLRQCDYSGTLGGDKLKLVLMRYLARRDGHTTG